MGRFQWLFLWTLIELNGNTKLYLVTNIDILTLSIFTTHFYEVTLVITVKYIAVTLMFPNIVVYVDR